MDAYLSEIVAVIEDGACDDIDQLVARLSQAGVEVWRVNFSECVVDGLVEAAKIKQIDDLPGVEYVRTVFTYVANYPPGDPRDRDGR
jgi:chemotaxis response regulator CheB